MLMEHGGEGLARLLKSPLLSQENIDLMEKRQHSDRLIQHWRLLSSASVNLITVMSVGVLTASAKLWEVHFRW